MLFLLTRVAATDDYGLLALPALGAFVLGRMHDGTFELVHVLKVWYARVSRKARSEYNMVWPHLARLLASSGDGDLPLLGLFVVCSLALQSRRAPKVQLHDLCVGLKEVGELVFRRELGLLCSFRSADTLQMKGKNSPKSWGRAHMGNDLQCWDHGALATCSDCANCLVLRASELSVLQGGS